MTKLSVELLAHDWGLEVAPEVGIILAPSLVMVASKGAETFVLVKVGLATG